MPKYYIKGILFNGIDIIETNIEKLTYQDDYYYTTDGILSFPSPPSGLWKLDIKKEELTLVDTYTDLLDFSAAYYIVGSKKTVKIYELGFIMGIEFLNHQQKEQSLLN